MADPTVIPIVTADVWQKVATNVTYGTIKIETSGPAAFLIKYVTSGDPTPVGTTGARRFNNGYTEKIADTVPSDIYVMAVKYIGSVSVDLTSDPIGRKDIDTFLQDQTTPAIEHYLYEILNAVTIDTNITKGDNTISLVAGHGFVNPVPATFSADYIVLNYIDEAQPSEALKYRFYQGRVVSVAGDVITVAIHLPFEIDITKIDSVYRVNTNMAKVVGTIAAPKVFLTTPVNGIKWDLTRLMIDMIASSAPDDGLFGGGAALTNGMFFGFESDITTFYEYLVNVQDNGGFRSTAFDVNYTTRTVPAGSYGISTRKSFAGRDKYGVAIRLDGETEDRFVTYIQDDMTAAGLNLERFRVKMQGHLVTN